MEHWPEAQKSNAEQQAEAHLLGEIQLFCPSLPIFSISTSCPQSNGSGNDSYKAPETYCQVHLRQLNTILSYIKYD